MEREKRPQRKGEEEKTIFSQIVTKKREKRKNRRENKRNDSFCERARFVCAIVSIISSRLAFFDTTCGTFYFCNVLLMDIPFVFVRVDHRFGFGLE